MRCRRSHQILGLGQCFFYGRWSFGSGGVRALVYCFSVVNFSNKILTRRQLNRSSARLRDGRFPSSARCSRRKCAFKGLPGKRRVERRPMSR